MLQWILYHGTEINRGHKILVCKRMGIYRRDKHWLGYGSYLFEEDFFAYKWIFDMYLDYFKKEPKNDNELYKELMIEYNKQLKKTANCKEFIYIFTFS